MTNDARLHPVLVEHMRRVGLDPLGPAPAAQPWHAFLRSLSERLHRLDADALNRTHRDALTGLPNRTAVLELLWVALRRGKGEVSVLFVDLDGFKAINDTHGHSLGDVLLVQAARRLQAAVREGDVVARLGGDEFVVMAPDCDGATAEALARRVGSAIDAPFDLGSQEAFVTASIGVAVAHEGVGLADLLQNADTAMYEAKSRGRAQYVRFDERMRAVVRHQVLTEAALHRAISHDELVVWFQPIVRMADRAVVCLEALVRWQRPGHGLVGATEFVPIAERSRLAAELDAWVMRRACEEAAGWPDRAVSVSVNVSARGLGDDALVPALGATLHRTGLAPSRLVVEMTERTMMSDSAAVSSNISKLRALGVRIAVDDFGTGYSSLSYLKRLPISILKIDRSFVVDLGNDPAAGAITTAIMGMANALGIEVVAEGVEDEAQDSFLQNLGCSRAQGFLYSAPVPPGSVGSSLSSGRIPVPR